MSQNEITIKELNKKDSSGFQQSQLVLQFSGKKATVPIINCLRRASMDYVPIYGFVPESIHIEKSDSVFNNDYMRLRISQMIIPNLPVDITYLPDYYWYSINYSDPERKKHPKDNTIYEFYINALNTTPEILNVTTNDLKLYKDGEEIQKFDPKYPQLIIQLRPKEVFHCHATAVLGVGKFNSIFSAVGIAYYEYKEDKPHEFKFTVESTGQMDEYEILFKSCYAMIGRYMAIKEKLQKEYNSDTVKTSKEMHLRLHGEDHTVGAPLNDFLQDHRDVVCSGLSKPYLLMDEIVIKFTTVKPNPLVPLYECIDQCIQVMTSIAQQIQKLGGKYIKSKI